MKKNQLRPFTPTYLILSSGVVRIDHVIESIDECVDAILKKHYIKLPLGLYSESELSEYEAHLEDKYSFREATDHRH